MKGYAGLMQGQVVSNDDPERRGRVRVSCPELLTDPDTGEVVPTPWCETGFMVDGQLNVPDIGDPVYLQSRYSDSGGMYQLVYTPGRPGETAEGDSRIPPVAREGEDESTGALKAGTPFKVPSFSNAAEMRDSRGEIIREGLFEDEEIPGLPGTYNVSSYPRSRVLKTKGGLLLEIDDTPGQERVHLWHSSGAYFEVNSEGVLVQRQTKKWEETADSETKLVGGSLRESVVGHRQVKVGAHDITEVAGRSTVRANEVDLVAKLNMLLEATGRFQLESGGPGVMDFLGGLGITSGEGLALTAMGKTCLQSAVDVAIQSLTGGVKIQAPTLGIQLNSTAGTFVGSVLAPLGPYLPAAKAPPIILAIEALAAAVTELTLAYNVHTHIVVEPVPLPPGTAGVATPPLVPAVTAVAQAAEAVASALLSTSASLQVF